MKLTAVVSTLLIATAWSFPAAADTSLELLHGWNYNQDFNGDPERTTLTIKTFQPWPYGTFFMFYDITGPFTPPDASASPNEKGGFFGSSNVTFSIKRIGQKLAGAEWDWGPLTDVSLRYELEHVSKFGSLHYYAMQWDLRVPYFDFFSWITSIRDDWSLSGVAFQLGGFWQFTVPIFDVTNVVCAGFFAWGITGEGTGGFTVGPDDKGAYAKIPAEGAPFFISQPQVLLDVGKLARVADNKVLAGVEFQIAMNRYLQQGVSENLAQLLFKWNL
jgi:hypothetical protein